METNKKNYIVIIGIYALWAVFIYLGIIGLFSCDDEPICDAKRDSKLIVYEDSVLNRLQDIEPSITYMRECLVLLLKEPPKNHANWSAWFNGTFGGSIYFNVYQYSFYTKYNDEYSLYLEFLMLHELAHYFYGSYELGGQPIDRTNIARSELDILYLDFVDQWRNSIYFIPASK